jgi:hypothetical protein
MSVIERQPGPARHSRKKNHEDATKAGMHSCRSRSARSSTVVLWHRVSSTRSHSPGPLPDLIHPVYWPVLGSQSLLNPRDHPRYLPPYLIDRTKPGPEGYWHVSRERGPILLGSQSLLNPRDHPRYLPPYLIDRIRPSPGGYRRVSRKWAWLPRPPLHFPLESVCLWWQTGQGQGQGRAAGAIWKRE